MKQGTVLYFGLFIVESYVNLRSSSLDSVASFLPVSKIKTTTFVWLQKGTSTLKSFNLHYLWPFSMPNPHLFPTGMVGDNKTTTLILIS